MFNPIAKNDFSVVTIQYPNDSRSSSSALLIHQFSNHLKNHDPHQKEVRISSHRQLEEMNELDRKSDSSPMALEMVVNIERTVSKKRKNVVESSQIRLFRLPIMISWVEALIAIFSQMPCEKRKVVAQISYSDILARRQEDRSQEPSNSVVMNESASDAFKRFMTTLPCTFTEEQLALISPKWCHIIMSSAVTASIAQQSHNLCCGPEGLNIAMRVPEHMAAKLAEYLDQFQKKVTIKVKLLLFSGTSVVKYMKYKIVTDDIKISVEFDHPFRMPHFKFENQGLAHLEDILDVKLEEGSRSHYRFGA